MADWDAARYHRISNPQFDWGGRVIARLRPMPGERILDVGCGTARLTHELASTSGSGTVVGLDRSAAMLELARRTAPALRYVQGDATTLPFRDAFDAVFSAATLHWVPDHDAAFASILTTLRPGGRFVAQCGGRGNLDRLLERAAVLMESPTYDSFFSGWRAPFYFADPGSTAARLKRAGFVEARAWIEDAPVPLPDAATFAEFIACVCIRHHLERLPTDRRHGFVGELTEQAARDDPPFLLDYKRLNLAALKAP